MTNLGADTWTSGNGYKLGYKVYGYSSGKLITTNASAGAITSSIAPRATGSVTATIKALPPGKYLIDWDMYAGSTSFSSQRVPVGKMALTVPAVAPTVTNVLPPTGYITQRLTPQLTVVAEDNNRTSVTYRFTVLDGTTKVADSGVIDDHAWTVPKNLLQWGKTYSWKVVVSDSEGASQTVGPSTLVTQVPQPPVTSHLGASGGDHGFDPQVGNFTTAATDASVATVGPDLTVGRTYNSLDADTTHAFGAGWSSRFDMKVTPDGDGSGNVVVTYPSGQQQRFGHSETTLSQLTGIGDHTGDGTTDAVSVDPVTGQLWLYAGPDFSGTNRVQAGTGWLGMSPLVGGDFDSDGVSDLIAQKASDNSLYLSKGIPGGGFATPHVLNSTWSAPEMAAGDFSGDGNLDLVAESTGTGDLYYWTGRATARSTPTPS